MTLLPWRRAVASGLASVAGHLVVTAGFAVVAVVWSYWMLLLIAVVELSARCGCTRSSGAPKQPPSPTSRADVNRDLRERLPCGPRFTPWSPATHGPVIPAALPDPHPTRGRRLGQYPSEGRCAGRRPGGPVARWVAHHGRVASFEHPSRTGTTARERTHHAVRSTELLSTVTGSPRRPQPIDARARPWPNRFAGSARPTTKLDSSVGLRTRPPGSDAGPAPGVGAVGAPHGLALCSGSLASPVATGLPRFERPPCTALTTSSSANILPTLALGTGRHRPPRVTTGLSYRPRSNRVFWHGAELAAAP